MSRRDTATSLAGRSVNMSAASKSFISQSQIDLNSEMEAQSTEVKNETE